MLIPLRSQWVSLLVTLGSSVTELVALWAALYINTVRESRALEKGHSVNLNRHLMRKRVITMVAAVIFVCSEIVVSNYSTTVFTDIKVQEPCITVKAGGNHNNATGYFEAITIGCLQPKGKLFSQHLGNYSLISDAVSCESSPAYEFETSTPLLRSLGNSTLKCIEEDECFFYQLEGNKFFFSEAIYDLAEVPQSIEFWQTRLFFNCTSAVYAAERLYEIWKEETLVEELFLRARIFTETTEQSCTFVKAKQEGTRIPVFIIFLIIGMWSVSLFVSCTVLLFARDRFTFDPSDPKDWTRTVLQLGGKSAQMHLDRETGRVVISESRESK